MASKEQSSPDTPASSLIIDMSTTLRQHRFLDGFTDTPNNQDILSKVIIWSKKEREFLVVQRGEVSAEFMDQLDENGHFVQDLNEFLGARSMAKPKSKARRALSQPPAAKAQALTDQLPDKPARPTPKLPPVPDKPHRPETASSLASAPPAAATGSSAASSSGHSQEWKAGLPKLRSFLRQRAEDDDRWRHFEEEKRRRDAQAKAEQVRYKHCNLDAQTMYKAPSYHSPSSNQCFSCCKLSYGIIACFRFRSICYRRPASACEYTRSVSWTASGSMATSFSIS